jgi:hypothetical protein
VNGSADETTIFFSDSSRSTLIRAAAAAGPSVVPG